MAKLDQTRRKELQASIYNNRMAPPMPEFRQLLEHELELVQEAVLNASDKDDMRILQGEGRRLQKILRMFDRQPLPESEKHQNKSQSS